MRHGPEACRTAVVELRVRARRPALCDHVSIHSSDAALALYAHTETVYLPFVVIVFGLWNVLFMRSEPANATHLLPAINDTCGFVESLPKLPPSVPALVHVVSAPSGSLEASISTSAPVGICAARSSGCIPSARYRRTSPGTAPQPAASLRHRDLYQVGNIRRQIRDIYVITLKRPIVRIPIAAVIAFLDGHSRPIDLRGHRS